MTKQSQKQSSKQTQPDKVLSDLKRFEKEAKENLAGWQRAKADYVNFKNQAQEEKVAFRELATMDLILELLPLVDNFDKAWDHLPKELEENQWVKGLEQIRKQLTGLLAGRGVEKISPKGDEFDPEQHEAVERVAGKGKSGVIVEMVQAGYKMNGKVIRAAKVKVVK